MDLKDKNYSETLNIKIDVGCSYWNTPPKAIVYCNDELIFNDCIKNNMIINFDFLFNIPEKNMLSLIRHGKTDAEVRNSNALEINDQLLWINTVYIDNTNIKDLIHHKSIFCPKYPEPWATEQKNSGIELEKEVIGETIFGHNGKWYFKFDSPFYDFMCRAVRGNI